METGYCSVEKVIPYYVLNKESAIEFMHVFEDSMSLPLSAGLHIDSMDDKAVTFKWMCVTMYSDVYYRDMTFTFGTYVRTHDISKGWGLTKVNDLEISPWVISHYFSI